MKSRQFRAVQVATIAEAGERCLKAPKLEGCLHEREGQECAWSPELRNAQQHEMSRCLLPWKYLNACGLIWRATCQAWLKQRFQTCRGGSSSCSLHAALHLDLLKQSELIWEFCKGKWHGHICISKNSTWQKRIEWMWGCAAEETQKELVKLIDTSGPTK